MKYTLESGSTTPNRDVAVLEALQHAHRQGKLGVVAAIHAIPEHLLRSAAIDHSVECLSEVQREWLSVDLKVW